MKNDFFSAVEIETNGACNQTCSYCPNSKYSRAPKGEMPLNLFEKVMKELKELNFAGRISYDFYNEPMLSPNFLNYLSLTRQYLPDANIEYYTNGTLLDFNTYTKMEAYNINYYIVTKHETIDQLPLEKFQGQLSDEQKSRIVFRNHTELVKTNRGGSIEGIGQREIPKLLPCYIPAHVVTITCEGNVLPCFEDFFEKNIMGNIKNNSLIEIWNSEKYMKFRKDLSNTLRHQHHPCNCCNRLQATKLITTNWIEHVLYRK